MIFTAATLLEMVVDTSGIFPAGNWFDIKSHLPILYTIARCATCTQNGEPVSQRPILGLEIGVRQGVSTMALLAGIRDGGGGKLISLDFDPVETAVAQRLVADYGLAPFWEFHLTDSTQWSECPDGLDFLWIDGEHKAPAPWVDVQNYAPHLRENGILLMHDYFVETYRGEDGVVQAVEALKATGQWEVCTLPWCYGLTIARKLVANSPAAGTLP
jgi:predicted O-methyltransferase YrrM